MKKKVFVIWRSKYDTDGISKIFSKRKDAEKFCDDEPFINREYIEEFDLE